MKLTTSNSALLLALSALSINATPVANSKPLPIIDLGYVKQQASSYNATGGFYSFNNIAFAQAPVGNLRWSAPKSPNKIKGVQNGRFPSPLCPQGLPAWLAGQSAQDPVFPPNPLENEDCLYLDVIVPESIFKKKQQASAPVLTWIYGGGNVIGSKQGFGPGDGLVERSIQNTSSDGSIFVAMNYRLGAFAFFGGEKYSSQGGTQNLGLLDQQLALEWIQKYICKFGGSADRVTVMGESGGAGAIGHHLTAPQYKDNAPFQQAIFQSPADLPEYAPNSFLDDQFTEFLKAVNVSTLQQAKSLNTTVLQNWNRNYNWASPVGRFEFFTTLDNEYVVSTLYQDLAAGHFDHKVKILTAHNSQEGAIFTPDLNNFDFRTYVQSFITKGSNATIDHITNDLYPASAFKNQAARANAFFGDILIDCVHYSIQRAFDRQGPAYLFAVPPGYHVDDVPYTFYDGPSSAVKSESVAMDMQSWIVNFAVHGDPNAAGGNVPQLPKYGPKGNMLRLTGSAASVVRDPNNNKRCEYWATYK